MLSPTDWTQARAIVAVPGGVRVTLADGRVFRSRERQAALGAAPPRPTMYSTIMAMTDEQWADVTQRAREAQRRDRE